jgi:uncharacterized protein (DUF1810 family)
MRCCRRQKPAKSPASNIPIAAGCHPARAVFGQREDRGIVPSAQVPMTSNNDFDLQRFVTAQAPVYADVCEELREGQKTSHWMWFIFPQIAGLGQSVMSRKYAVSSLDEARAYLAHPVLGPRLIECTRLVGVSGRSVEDIFGSPDDMKFRSSMTLFARAQGEGAYQDAVDRYFDGEYDDQTIIKLKLAGF